MEKKRDRTPTKQIKTSISIDEQSLKKLKTVAKKKDRSVSYVVRKLIEKMASSIK